MTITDCWNEFRTVHQQFHVHFIAYQYLRKKQWIPRSGLRYGTVFSLYRQGPQQSHAEYAVLVQTDQQDINWKQLICTLRVTRQVLKVIHVR